MAPPLDAGGDPTSNSLRLSLYIVLNIVRVQASNILGCSA